MDFKDTKDLDSLIERSDEKNSMEYLTNELVSTLNEMKSEIENSDKINPELAYLVSSALRTVRELSQQGRLAELKV